MDDVLRRLFFCFLMDVTQNHKRAQTFCGFKTFTGFGF